MDVHPGPDPQTHLIYLLLDSNLPTGGFVASSGLESWAKHGFLGNFTEYNLPPPAAGPSSRHAGSGNGAGPTVAAKRVTEFLDAEVETYARGTGGYVRRGWEIVAGLLDGRAGCGQCGDVSEGGSGSKSPDLGTWNRPTETQIDDILQHILALDHQHESTLLSHVSRRASKAQGVAILTLYTKGLSRPPGYTDYAEYGDMIGVPDPGSESAKKREVEMGKEETAAAVIEGYKRLIRRNIAPGHLAVCWGVMTAGLGLSLDKSYHLYLFLHIRSLLSAAVRLNLIGPYLSSQLLLHPAKGIIERYVGVVSTDDSRFDPAVRKGDCYCTVGHGVGSGEKKSEEHRREEASGEEVDFWAWTAEAECGPATTWPLGEVLIARHDLQHSRIFNS